MVPSESLGTGVDRDTSLWTWGFVEHEGLQEDKTSGSLLRRCLQR